MPLVLRRIIYWSFIACFLLVAPILALYSMGYRYHWGKHRIERTGLIVLDGMPRDATVRIDGEIRAQRLPARVGGLGENEYTIRVERDGFHPWEERVLVTSGRTTSATDMLLFRDALPTLELDGPITRTTVSADGQWLAFSRRQESFEELWIVDLTSTKRTIALRTPIVNSSLVPRPSPLAFTWSPRNATLLVTTASAILTIDPHDVRLPRSLSNLLPRRPSTIAWELGSGNALIAAVDGRLLRISLLTGRTVTLPVPAPAGPFAVARGSLFTVTTRALTVTTIDGGATNVISTGDATITTLVDLQGSVLAAETDHQILDIALTTGNVRTRTGYGLRGHVRDGVVAWHGTPFELWEESGDPPQPRLLARRDTPIVDAAWHPNAPYVLLATAHDITAINRNVPNRPPVTLAMFDDLQTVAIDRTGATLLIIGRRGTTEGLWSLQSQ
ncbi:MAG: PEGA domain-containing protein [bacterium]|nr:PEGA domain-containing protein [bacterium]